MILKKKGFFLLIFLFLLQSCSGGRIGNFLESSFSDLEEISQDDDLQKNLVNKEIQVKENKEIQVKENKEIQVKENNEIQVKENKKIKKAENPQSVLKNKKDKNLEKISQDDDLQKNLVNKKIQVKEDKEINGIKNKKIKNSSKKRKIRLQSYRIIFLLKDVDPKDPTEELSTILRNSEVNFEIEKIERILDTKNKSMKKN